MTILIIFYYVLFAFWSAIAGSGEGLRIKDVIANSIVWHNQQWLERVGLFLSGMCIGIFSHAFFSSDLYSFFITIIIMSITSGIIFFILYDGVINMKLNNAFFYVSPTSKAWTEQFAHWWIKIPLLIVMIVLNIILI